MNVLSTQMDLRQPFARTPCCKISHMCSNSVMNTHLRITHLKWRYYDDFELLALKKIERNAYYNHHSRTTYVDSMRTNIHVVVIAGFSPKKIASIVVISMLGQRVVTMHSRGLVPTQIFWLVRPVG